jgi:hypothetical protein
MNDPKERPSPWPTSQPDTGRRIYDDNKRPPSPHSIPLTTQDAAYPLPLETDEDYEDDQ